MNTGDRADLRAVLEQARSQGFLGPGPVDSHIDHAFGFTRGQAEPTAALDLGSGAGVPGLALAYLTWPDTAWILLDAGQRRCAFLEESLEELGLGGRVQVVRSRAEDAGRDLDLRGTCDLVTARSFGPPAVTAECAAPFLAIGGRLVVSEPPGGAPHRWPDAGLGLLGLARVADRDQDTSGRGGPAMAVFEAVAVCPDRFPRRVGIPAKRPLF